MKQTPSEIIALLTAIKDGAEWEKRQNENYRWVGCRGWDFREAMAASANGCELRLKPKPVMVPLGPEDWEGAWWVKPAGQGGRQLVVSVYHDGISFGRDSSSVWGHLQKNYLRSRDGKNWEPCEELQS